MRFEATPLEGVWVIEPQRQQDERGFFARTWCAEEMKEHGLSDELSQCSLSFSRRQKTLRGMHFQIPPAQEVKVVRCTMGAIYDVVLDLRLGSPTFLQWFASELTAANRRSIYIPHGCAHGLLTLHDNTEVLYQMSGKYSAAHARGVRWDDEAFGIEWPAAPQVISERDRDYPDFSIEAHLAEEELL